MYSVALPAVLSHGPTVYSVAFSPDGSRLLTGGPDGRARLWDARTGRPLAPPLEHPLTVFDVLFSPDSQTIWTACADGLVRRWDATTGRPVGPALVQPHAVSAMTMDPEGEFLLTITRDVGRRTAAEARLWDVASGQPVGPPLIRGDELILEATFAPEENVLLTFSSNRIIRRRCPIPVVGGPAQIAAWARHLAGLALDPSGGIQAVDAEGWAEAHRHLAAVGGPPAPPPDLLTPTAWHREQAARAELTLQWFGAVWHLDRLLADAPRDAALLARRGQAQAQLGHWDRALVDYSAAIGQDASRSRYAARAGVFERLERWEEAANDYVQSIPPEVPPAGPPPRLGSSLPSAQVTVAERCLRLGDVYGRLGRWEDAAVAYGKAIEYWPGNRPARAGRAFASAELGRWDQAAADYAEVVRLNPQDARSWGYLADAQMGAGRPEEFRKTCVAMFRRFAEAPNPSTPSELLYACVWVPETVSDLPTLLRLARLDLDQYRGDTLIHGPLLYRSGRFEEAIRKLDEAEPTRPRRAWEWLFLAMAHHRLGHASEAESDLDRARRWIAAADRPQPVEGGARWFGWFERLEVHALRKEAEALIDPASPP